jgi:hypothetical protein
MYTSISCFTTDGQHVGRNAYGLCPIKVFESSWLLLYFNKHLVIPSAMRLSCFFFIHPAFLYVRFRDNEFLQGRVVSRTPNQPTNLEDQGLSSSLASPSKPVRHVWPGSNYATVGISFRVHWCAHVPSPSNKVLSTKWRYHRGGFGWFI